jgi:hypothetical protein
VVYPALEIEFDCLPLRSVTRWEAPADASPKLREFCARLAAAQHTHGAHNTYYLHNARCIFRVTNHPLVGMLEFQFEGVVLTDADDRLTCGSDLTVQLTRETCPWLTEPVVEWFRDSVQHAVRVEFDRYIAAGDLEKTRQRIAQLQAESDRLEGFLGMYL